MCILQQTSEEWRSVLFISCGVSVFGMLVYGLFASSELAPWANDPTNLEIKVEVAEPLNTEEAENK